MEDPRDRKAMAAELAEKRREYQRLMGLFTRAMEQIRSAAAVKPELYDRIAGVLGEEASQACPDLKPLIEELTSREMKGGLFVARGSTQREQKEDSRGLQKRAREALFALAPQFNEAIASTFEEYGIEMPALPHNPQELLERSSAISARIDRLEAELESSKPPASPKPKKAARARQPAQGSIAPEQGPGPEGRVPELEARLERLHEEKRQLDAKKTVLDNRLTDFERWQAEQGALADVEFDKLLARLPGLKEQSDSFHSEIARLEGIGEKERDFTESNLVKAEYLRWVVETRRSLGLDVPEGLEARSADSSEWRTHVLRGREVDAEAGRIEAELEQLRKRLHASSLLESEVSGREKELASLQEALAGLDKRSQELASRFNPRLIKAISGFGGLPLEQKAEKALEALPRNDLTALHDAMVSICSHSAVRAAGMADISKLSREHGDIGYFEPPAVGALLAARDALLAGRVATGYPDKGWQYATELNAAAAGYFKKVIPGFDALEQKHWDKLASLVEGVYRTMQLHEEIAKHIAEKQQLEQRIEQKKADLDAARKRLAEHRKA